MKKTLLISVSLLTLSVVTGIYAQTVAGTSLVDKMKAAAQNFTLSALLNPGETGLQSAPVKGKKTGDILTAGEWNRVLELVSSGGAATASLPQGAWCGLTVTQATPAGVEMIKIDGTNVVAGVKQNVALCEGHDPSVSCPSGYARVFHWSTAYVSNTTIPGKMEFCVNKTGSTGGSGGSGWENVPLTDTTPFDKTCEYRFTINTNGDNASIGGTNPIFYAAAVDPFAITYVSHSSVVTHILASSKNVFRANGAPVYTVTKIEKLCGGGGSTSSATCPSGFVAVGSYCIEPTMSAKGKTWYEAGVACADKGAQLCQWSEWAIACKKGALTDVKFGTTLGVYEWIDDYTGGAYQAIADPRVYSNCEYLSRADPHGGTTPVADIAYRCCSPKQ